MIGAVTRWYPEPFTAEQWEELQQQALIYKYLVLGVPVPPHLIFSLECSFVQRSSSSSLPSLFPRQPRDCYEFQYEAVGGGRKIDREPGRCRRTDGKKWRCSREAYPDSKYCKRHLHCGRHCSRKPVESLTTTIALISTHSHHKSYPGFLHHHHQPSSMYTPSVLSLSSPDIYTNRHSSMPFASFAPPNKHNYDRYKSQGSRGGGGGGEYPYNASPKMTSSHHYSHFNFQNFTDKLKEHQQEEERRTRGQCFVMVTDIKTQGSIKPFHHFFSNSEWLNTSDQQSAQYS